MKKTLTWAAALLTSALPFSTPAAPASLNEFLRDGRIEEALAAYAAPANDGERFSLAALQALEGLRQFSAGFNALGVHPEITRIPLPFLRAVVPAKEPKEASATPEKVAALFRDLRASLQRANATLAQLGAEEFGVDLSLTQARLDFDGDGAASPAETIEAAFSRMMGAPRGASDLFIRFDRADAAWLKGYTHFLLGLIDLLTAYDWRPAWNQCAHVLFLRPDPMPPIAQLSHPDHEIARWADLIAAVHDTRLELLNPAGPRSARDQFVAMIQSSRVCWKYTLAEKDNEHEWLPNPQQTGPRATKITQNQIDAWMTVLDELEAIAGGRKLLPHWRLRPGTGININRLVDGAPRFDFVLWLQGSAFVPFIEEGPVSDSMRWRELTSPFGPGFFRFALWSN